MNKIAIVALEKKLDIPDFMARISLLEKRYDIKFETFFYSNKDFDLYNILHREKKDITKEFSAALSVGGDGTFLYTSRVFAGLDIPIFGINMGQLGFNTNVEIDELEEYLKKFIDGEALFDYKTLLEVHVEGEKEIFTVLNEGVISHTGISRMIRMKVYLEGRSVCDFNGDGLIISTPTGSTAYNLSAGGPILHPSVDSYVITPICPHTLAIRPYIVPFSESIIVKIKESSAQPQITLDGQKVILLDIGQKITFKKSDKTVKVVRGKRSFSEILKLKLGWTV